MAAEGAPSSSAPQFASLYVGDLHNDVTEAMLYEIFNSVGPVASIRVCRDSVTRRSLGYAYVNYHGVSDAERALDTLNYSSIKGRSCRIMWSQRDPTLRKNGTGNIYVKNLDKSIDNKALYDTFSLFGNILSCKVASDGTGKSNGYGFVHYETEEAAKQAIEKVNGMQIGEKTVQVTEFVRRGPSDGTDKTNFTNLYVKNYPQDWDEAKLTETFEKYGKITSMLVRTDGRTSRSFAFVNYETTEEAHACVDELHDKDLRSEEQIAKDKDEGKEDEKDFEGHPLSKMYVQRAQSKAERQAELRAKFGSDKSSGVNLYVKNLDENFDEGELKDLFTPFGAIQSVSAPKDDKGRSKGFGFVCFGSAEEATKAVTEMHLKVIKGKPLYVGLAEKRDVRQERLKRMPGGADAKGGKSFGKGGGFGKGGAGPQGYPPQGMMPPMMMGKGMPGGMMGGMMPGMMPMKGMPGPMGQKGGPMQQMPMMMMGKGGPMMAKGGMMMPPQMGPMPGMVRPQMMQQQPPPQQAQPPPAASQRLDAATLAAAAPAQQKQMIGERLYGAISRLKPDLAGKITGMMLEMDNSELLLLLESEQQLKTKVDEAIAVLGQK